MSIDNYTHIVIDAIRTIIGHAPIGFQLPSITHILRMMTGELSPGPVLLVQLTRTGKSAVPLACVVIDYSVSIIIENTLALGIDQVAKAQNTCGSSQNSRIECYHLDSITAEEYQQTIVSFIVTNYFSCKVTCFVLYCSLETLFKKCWIDFACNCVHSKILTFFT